MDYKTLRKNYRLYIRSAGLLAMLLIICIGFVVRDTLLQTAGLVLVLAGLFLFIQLLKKSYTNKCNTLLHVDLDLAFWQQYLQLNKNVKKAISQIDIKLTSVAYSFMMGDFDAVIKETREALSQKELPQKYKNLFESYLIRSIVLTDPDLSREELEAQLNGLTITDPTLAEKTRKVCLALYDLTIAHQSNDYFEDLSNDFKYQQLEIIYYQALNATLKGDQLIGLTTVIALFGYLMPLMAANLIMRDHPDWVKKSGIRAKIPLPTAWHVKRLCVLGASLLVIGVGFTSSFKPQVQQTNLKDQQDNIQVNNVIDVPEIEVPTSGSQD